MDEMVMILGAGPAGLAAGFELLDSNISFKIIEKNSNVGGLARTLRHGDNYFDIGPHILCSKEYIYDFNEEMYNLICDIFNDELIFYEDISKPYVEKVMIDNNMYVYPIQLKNALLNVGLKRSFVFLFDYLMRYKNDTNSEKNSFEDAMVRNLGRSLANLFILNYSEKIWGLKCSDLSSDLAWRVGEFSLLKVVENTIKNISLNDRNKGSPVCYPEMGIGQICEKLKENILASNNSNILLNGFPQKIIHDGSRIIDVIINNNGEIQYGHPQFLISSIPLQELISLLYPPAPKEVLESINNLKYRSHVSLVIIVNKPRIGCEHCIYYPDPKIPFARIMEQKNYSDKMLSNNNTSLLIEFFCWEDDNIWKANKDDLLELCTPWLENMDLVHKDEIVDMFVHREKNAYPIYDIDYRKSYNIIKNYISSLSNLKIIGRAGSFSYVGQYKSMEMGIVASRDLLNHFQHKKEHSFQDVHSDSGGAIL